jgi:hypothetical protein
MKAKVYYAHCMAIYGTPQEDRDIETLEDLGFEVVNPNQPAVRDACAVIRQQTDEQNAAQEQTYGRYGYAYAKLDASEQIMTGLFKPLVQSCDALAFRALPDGGIPAGVAKEVQWALDFGYPVVELPSNMTRRGMSIVETREYLAEIGQR